MASMKQGFKTSFGVVFGIVAALLVICCGVPLSCGLLGSWGRKPADPLKPIVNRVEAPKPMRETTLADIKAAMDSNEVYAMDTLRSNRWTVTFPIQTIIDNPREMSVAGDSGDAPYIIGVFVFSQADRAKVAALTSGQTVTIEADFAERDREIFTFRNCKIKP